MTWTMDDEKQWFRSVTRSLPDDSALHLAQGYQQALDHRHMGFNGKPMRLMDRKALESECRKAIKRVSGSR